MKDLDVLKHVISSEELDRIIKLSEGYKLKNNVILCVSRSEVPLITYTTLMGGGQGAAKAMDSLMQGDLYYVSASNDRSVKELELSKGDRVMIDPSGFTIPVRHEFDTQCLIRQTENYPSISKSISDAANKPGGRDKTFVVYSYMMLKPHSILSLY